MQLPLDFRRVAPIIAGFPSPERFVADPSNTQKFLRVERTEAALRLSEATKTAILDAALDCIVTIDASGLVLDWNPAAATTFGYPRAEAIGREMAELIIPARLRAMHRQGLARAVASGQDLITGKRIEISACRKNGEEFPVELAITRIADAVGTLKTVDPELYEMAETFFG